MKEIYQVLLVLILVPLFLGRDFVVGCYPLKDMWIWKSIDRGRKHMRIVHINDGNYNEASVGELSGWPAGP